MSSDGKVPEIPFSLVVTTGCITVVLASVLAYMLRLDQQKKKSNNINMESSSADKKEEASAAVPHIDREIYPGGSITVYFATQTGTAESFAREIEREGPDRGFLVHVVDLEDVTDIDTLRKVEDPTDPIKSIFLTATYGEGEPTDNATHFVDMLKEQTGLEVLFDQQQDDNEINKSDFLKDINYAVFGLGNEQYDHFNAMGKFFDKALEFIGGKRIIPIGLGNDDDDLENDFELWKENILWPTLIQKYISSDSNIMKQNGTTNKQKASSVAKLPECALKVIYHDKTKKYQPVFNLPSDKIHSSSRHYFTAVDCPVTELKELRPNNISTGDDDVSGSTVHIEIDISKAKTPDGKPITLSYTTADNLGVLPINRNEIVEKVAKLLKFDLDAVISVEAAPNHEWHGIPFPMPCTVRECLTRYCDLQAPPRRSDLKLLANYCTDITDQKALIRMSSMQGREEYKEKILHGYVGLVDLLSLCPSIQMPIEHFIDVCSPLQTRFFTICSSSSVYPSSIHLTVSVTKHERSNGSVFHGVCSTYLSETGTGNTIRVFNRPSTFRLPNDSSRPIIMIGPGTGVAPMRAFLQERAHIKKKFNKDIGKNILYFGCKKKTQDYIYQNELEQFVQDGILDHLRIAFSRENTEKVYVQHLLKQYAAETWSLINNDNAHIYVCGGVRMGHDVSETLKQIISECGGMSADASNDYLKKLSHDGRYIQELWA